MTTLYVNEHRSQYDVGSSRVTRVSGCTWVAGANGADAATGGAKDRTADWIHSLLKPWEETSPGTPGWSLPDLDLAMRRLNVAFEVRSGDGWSGVVAAHRADLYVVMQGLSSEFGDRTCSGNFEGPHCIGMHPDEVASGRWRIDDSICPTARYEDTAILRRYAERFSRTVAFGVFTSPVPTIALPDTGTDHYMAHLDGGAVVRVYDLRKGNRPVACIVSWEDVQWGRRKSSVPCTKPVLRSTCDGRSSAVTTLIRSGRFEGKYVRVGNGVTVVEE